MALSSMTGFARGQGTAGSYAWNWEIKSVNAKGLDLRFRLPPGWDAVEVPARARGRKTVARDHLCQSYCRSQRCTADSQDQRTRAECGSFNAQKPFRKSRGRSGNSGRDSIT